tara:strand:+ start:1964 stop:2179 length:216 start_codon:yes stop_codon:yes gene_type:complete
MIAKKIQFSVHFDFVGRDTNPKLFPALSPFLEFLKKSNFIPYRAYVVDWATLSPEVKKIQLRFAIKIKDLL